MISVWQKGGRELAPLERCAATALADAIWIDAMSPTAEEAAAVEAATGLHVASVAELEEIEISSRLAERNGAIYLSLPWATQDGTSLRGAPIGFALAPDRLLTVRFAPVTILQGFGELLQKQPVAPTGGAMVFIALLEAMVDGIADRLERMHADLEAVSRRIFKSRDPATHGPARVSEELRLQLRAVGEAGEAISGIRDTLLAFGRLIPYVGRREIGWLPPELRGRLKTLREDVTSLTDYDTHLTDKVQFLLDAILGFINIEQNNIIKLMTVVGVVGVPPTLIASIYGMNFENMPELHFHFAYPVALFGIALSALLPVLWFRRRGWL